MKKVLIALDYEPAALKIAERGYSMAKALNAEVILLHVITNPEYYTTSEYSAVSGYTGMDLPENAEGLKKASRHFLEKLKKHLGDQTIKTMVREGDYADSILEAANDIQSQLIVLGSHRGNWMDEVILGSVTEKVLNHSSVPLFIIPTKSKY